MYDELAIDEKHRLQETVRLLRSVPIEGPLRVGVVVPIFQVDLMNVRVSVVRIVVRVLDVRHGRDRGWRAGGHGPPRRDHARGCAVRRARGLCPSESFLSGSLLVG